WRVCQYAGSRYQDDRPMNVTALKAMIKHWKPMMAALLAIRAAVRERLAYADGEPWRIGDLHTFASAVVALPAFALMRGGGTSPQPALHPVLSSLFRVTDGIRMVTHDMMFPTDEPPRDPSLRVSADDLYGFVERNGTFIGDFGVCAGPRA